MFSIIAHTGNLLAPLLFAMLNVRLRQALREFIRSSNVSNQDGKEIALDETIVTTPNI